MTLLLGAGRLCLQQLRNVETHTSSRIVILTEAEGPAVAFLLFSRGL